MAGSIIDFGDGPNTPTGDSVRRGLTKLQNVVMQTNTALVAQVTSLQSQLTSVRAQLVAALADNVDNAAQIQSLQAEITSLEQQIAELIASGGDTARSIVVTNDQQALEALAPAIAGPYGASTAWTLPDGKPASVRVDTYSDGSLVLRRAGLSNKVTPGTSATFRLRATAGSQTVDIVIVCSFLATAIASPYAVSDSFLHASTRPLVGTTTLTGNKVWAPINPGTTPALSVQDGAVVATATDAGGAGYDIPDGDIVDIELIVERAPTGTIQIIVDSNGPALLVASIGSGGVELFHYDDNRPSGQKVIQFAQKLEEQPANVGTSYRLIYQRSTQRMTMFRVGLLYLDAVYPGLISTGRRCGLQLLGPVGSRILDFRQYESDITTSLLTYDANNPFFIPAPAVVMKDVYVLKTASQAVVQGQLLQLDGSVSPRSFSLRASLQNVNASVGSISASTLNIFPSQQCRFRLTIPITAANVGYFDVLLNRSADVPTLAEARCRVYIVDAYPAGYTPPPVATIPALPAWPMAGVTPDEADTTYEDFITSGRWSSEFIEINQMQGVSVIPGTTKTVSGANAKSPFERASDGHLIIRIQDQKADNVLGFITNDYPQGRPLPWGTGSIIRTFPAANVEYYALDVDWPHTGPAINGAHWDYDDTNNSPTEPDYMETAGGNADGNFADRVGIITFHLSTYPGPDKVARFHPFGARNVRRTEQLQFDYNNRIYRMWIDGVLTVEHLAYPMMPKRFPRKRLFSEGPAGVASGGSYDPNTDYGLFPLHVHSYKAWRRNA